MTDWDAARYHRLSEPQRNWGRRVLERLGPRPGERILDIGCGTGLLTEEIAGWTGSFVAGLDRSSAMIGQALTNGGCRARYVQGDAADLPFVAAFDGVFSAATFHWVPDHDRLFAGIHASLRPGGRLVAQCGGGPNLKRLIDRAHALMNLEPYRPHVQGWRDPWRFAYPAETRDRLARAGFEDIHTSLEEAPTAFADADAFANFIACVCVRHHVDRLPSELRAPFVVRLTSMASRDDPPFALDYWRLNIHARKAGA